MWKRKSRNRLAALRNTERWIRNTKRALETLTEKEIVRKALKEVPEIKNGLLRIVGVKRSSDNRSIVIYCITNPAKTGYLKGAAAIIEFENIGKVPVKFIDVGKYAEEGKLTDIHENSHIVNAAIKGRMSTVYRRSELGELLIDELQAHISELGSKKMNNDDISRMEMIMEGILNEFGVRGRVRGRYMGKLNKLIEAIRNASDVLTAREIQIVLMNSTLENAAKNIMKRAEEKRNVKKR